MAVEIVATLTPVMFLAIGQVATITNNTAAPLLLKRASSAPASIIKPDNIIPAFTTETVSAGDKPFFGVWQAALTPSGEAIVNEVTGFRFVNPNLKTNAFRVSGLREGQSSWGMIIDASEELMPTKSIFVHKIESRVEKGNRVDTEGFVSAVHVISIDENGANVLYFGGDFWDDGEEQSVNVFSEVSYNLTVSNDAYTHIKSTGQASITSLTTATDIPAIGGGTVNPQAGDLLFFMDNDRVDGDTASITVNWEEI